MMVFLTAGEAFILRVSTVCVATSFLCVCLFGGLEGWDQLSNFLSAHSCFEIFD